MGDIGPEPLSLCRRDGKELQVSLTCRDQCGKCGEICAPGLEATFAVRHPRIDCPNAETSKDCALGCGASFIGQRAHLADWERSHPPVCPNRPTPCKYECGIIVQNRKLDMHHSQCPNRPDRCALCYKKLKFWQLIHHETECPRRNIRCIQCGIEGYAIDMDDHECLECEDCGAVMTDPPHCPFHPDCPKQMVDCPKECGILCRRDELPEHNLSCTAEMVECELGCGFMTTRELAQEHMDSCMAPCSICHQLVLRVSLQQHEAFCCEPEEPEIAFICKPAFKPPPPPPPPPRKAWQPTADVYHPYPVCNGYCRKRWRIARSAKPGRHVERDSWMMCKPVSIHWNAPGKKQIQDMRDEGVTLRPKNEENPLKSPPGSRPASPQRKSRPPSRASLGLYSPKVSKSLSKKMAATARARRQSAPCVSPKASKKVATSPATSGRRSATPTCGTRKVKTKAKPNLKPRRSATPSPKRSSTPAKKVKKRPATPARKTRISNV